MVSSSGSSSGSAQSTMMSQPQTRVQPFPIRCLAIDADLWLSYSRNANPRFFFFMSSGELYMMTSRRPSSNKNNWTQDGVERNKHRQATERDFIKIALKYLRNLVSIQKHELPELNRSSASLFLLLCTCDVPVCFRNSSRMSSLLLFFGMLPTNKRTLATDMLILRSLPGRISKPFSWKFDQLNIVSQGNWNISMIVQLNKLFMPTYPTTDQSPCQT